jgi:hypothetical protein
MTTGSKPRIDGRGYSAAVRRFPNSEFVIRRLASHSETFRDICEELAEAETALSMVSQETRDVDRARKQEWQELVDRLVAEVSASLLGATREHTSPDQHRSGASEEEQR